MKKAKIVVDFINKDVVLLILKEAVYYNLISVETARLVCKKAGADSGFREILEQRKGALRFCMKLFDFCSRDKGYLSLRMRKLGTNCIDGINIDLSYFYIQSSTLIISSSKNPTKLELKASRNGIPCIVVDRENWYYPGHRIRGRLISMMETK